MFNVLVETDGGHALESTTGWHKEGQFVDHLEKAYHGRDVLCCQYDPPRRGSPVELKKVQIFRWSSCTHERGPMQSVESIQLVSLQHA